MFSQGFKHGRKLTTVKMAWLRLLLMFIFVSPKCLFSGKYQLQRINRRHLYYIFQFIYPIVLWDYLETTVQKQDTVNYGRENKAKSSKGQRLIQW